MAPIETNPTRVQGVIFANKIVNGLANAHVHGLDTIQETYRLNDVQFDVVRNLAFNASGIPQSKELRQEFAEATRKLPNAGVNLYRLPSREIIDMINRQLTQDRLQRSQLK
jgi:hypothetical protein